MGPSGRPEECQTAASHAEAAVGGGGGGARVRGPAPPHVVPSAGAVWGPERCCVPLTSTFSPPPPAIPQRVGPTTAALCIAHTRSTTALGKRLMSAQRHTNGPGIASKPPPPPPLSRDELEGKGPRR